MYDLRICGGKAYLDRQWVQTNLYVTAGRIANISDELLPAVKHVDADGLKIIPGIIDPHVHLAMGSGPYTSADDFYSGSIAAAWGGVTTYIDFLDERPTGEGIQKEFERKRKLAQNSIVDYSFHAAICELQDTAGDIASAALTIGSPTIKLYTTYKPAAYSSDETVEKMIRRSAENDIRILCHAEDDDLIRFDLQEISQLSKARPAEVEVAQVLKIAEFVRKHQGNAYIVHVSSGTTIQRLSAEYGNILNRRLFLESAPHYFYFDDSVYQGSEAFRYSMTPPLKSLAEQRILKENWRLLSVFATDHCPFMTYEKKNKKISEMPMGVGGVEHSFILMYQLFGEEVIERYTRNPAVLHGLYPQKGSLQIDSDADLVFFDDSCARYKLPNHSNQDQSIYQDTEVQVKIEKVMASGSFVINNGVQYGRRGKYLRRKLTSIL